MSISRALFFHSMCGGCMRLSKKRPPEGRKERRKDTVMTQFLPVGLLTQAWSAWNRMPGTAALPSCSAQLAGSPLAPHPQDSFPSIR